LPVEQFAQVFDGAMKSLAGCVHGDIQSHGDRSILETKFSNESTVRTRKLFAPLAVYSLDGLTECLSPQDAVVLPHLW
jgi:hypothetical protein